MSQGKQGGPPQPEQAVAAATTKTGPTQENARTMRTTDWLRAGEEPPGPAGPAARGEGLGDKKGTPSCAAPPASAPGGPLVLTEAEGVPPPQAPAPGEPAPAAAPPAPADPADLVRTEAERVPPPDRRRP